VSKRKVSVQQQRRINQRQLSAHKSGRVIARLGKYVDVLTDDKQYYQCRLRQHIHPITGDIVSLDINAQQEAVITQLAERKNSFGPFDKQGKVRPLAANIDLLFIVIAPKPALNFFHLDSYCAAAALLSITPIIIFNKIDLLDETDYQAFQCALEYYDTLDYPILHTSVLSTKTKFFCNELTLLKKDTTNKTTLFIGQSGVGKSSLIHTLLPQKKIRIGELSSVDKGMHTTTKTEWFPLEEGGAIIDAPGMKAFELGKVPKEKVALGFREIKKYSADCHFHNCTHLNEPDCVVRNKVESKEILKSRYENYQKLYLQQSCIQKLF